MTAAPSAPLVTRTTLAEDLRLIGLRAGTTVLVHASLSRVGQIFGGGTQAVIEALTTVLGDDGTLMMPTHSGDLTEPSRWRDPPAPPGTVDAVRDALPAWDPARTPTRRMGLLAEHFRSWPGVLRSDHPHVSFAALGPHARRLTEAHRCGEGFGDSSPLGRLHDLDGEVLLIGVGHGNDTSLHLAEARADWPGKRTHEEGAPRLVDGERVWTRFAETVWDDEDFEACGMAWERTRPGSLRMGHVGAATTRLLRQRPLVDFAVDWLSRHRSRASR